MLISNSNCQIQVFCRILIATTEQLGRGIFYNGLDTLLMGYSVDLSSGNSDRIPIAESRLWFIEVSDFRNALDRSCSTANGVQGPWLQNPVRYSSGSYHTVRINGWSQWSKASDRFMSVRTFCANDVFSRYHGPSSCVPMTHPSHYNFHTYLILKGVVADLQQNRRDRMLGRLDFLIFLVTYLAWISFVSTMIY